MSAHWKELLHLLKQGKYVYTDTVALAAATYVSRTWIQAPLWILVIAPPGTGKTCAVEQFAQADFAHMVSSVTPASLITAWGGSSSDRSLFSRIDQTMLIVKDFGTILTMNWDAIQVVFSLLREAFDGHVVKEFATCVREYTLHFNMIAASTEVVYRNSHFLQQLGERFIRYEPPPVQLPWPMPVLEEGLALQVAQWCEQLPQEPAGVIMEEAPGAATVIGVLRTEFPHAMGSHEILEIVHPEHSSRLSQQFNKLYVSLVTVTGDEEYSRALTLRCVRDTIPRRRRSVLKALWPCEPRSTAELAEEVGIGPQTMRMELQDMYVLGILEREMVGFPRMYTWCLPKDQRKRYNKYVGDISGE